MQIAAMGGFERLRNRPIAGRLFYGADADVILRLVGTEDDLDAGEGLLLAELDCVQRADENPRVIFVRHPYAQALVEEPATSVLKKYFHSSLTP